MSEFNVAVRDRFLNDPIAFIDNAAFWVSGSAYAPELPGRPDRLTLKHDPNTVAYKPFAIGDDIGMKRIPVYAITKAGPRDTMYFQAYIIEYVATKTPLTILGTKAEIAFTANMNGCTLGIGSQASPSDAMVVTHSNSSGHGSQSANTADQARKAGTAVGEGGLLFEPTEYRTNDRQSITFGVRKPGQRWSFHYLSYRRAQGRITSYGVQPVTGNRVAG